MSLSLVSNADSIKAQTNLKRTTQALSKTFERLSSGLRINSAADDAAGLQVADKLRSDARLAAVAIRNANDGLSLTAVADSALNEIYNMLSRMAELAQQSANGSYTQSQRSALSSEFLALGSEIDRISKTTTFNSINLLSGSSNITLQVGLDNSTDSRITLQAVSGTLASLGLAPSGSSTLTYSIITISTDGSTYAAGVALSAINTAISNLTATRGTLGASESRLSSAINYLTVARENFIAAESRIRDADVAQEVAEMVRLQVLQQSGAAVLAQANLQPEIVLALLQ
ncbi:MAG: flagellin FliC [Deltaproteobacteria bacterium]|nr:flagellin FliC [Deltaproteobacteria bacterium]